MTLCFYHVSSAAINSRREKQQDMQLRYVMTDCVGKVVYADFESEKKMYFAIILSHSERVDIKLYCCPYCLTASLLRRNSRTPISHISCNLTCGRKKSRNFCPLCRESHSLADCLRVKIQDGFKSTKTFQCFRSNPKTNRIPQCSRDKAT